MWVSLSLRHRITITLTAAGTPEASAVIQQVPGPPPIEV
jgi:hypothetical protein